jgi:feruloyl esterase
MSVLFRHASRLLLSAVALALGTMKMAMAASGPIIIIHQSVPARIECAALVQNAGTRNLNVPDFLKIPGAPTRITSATIVPATATQPEYCDVRGYVQPQVEFELKLPTATWQGRYAQFGCGGVCGFITPTSFPDCRTQLGGDFAVAVTNDGHNASAVDALWAGISEQYRIDFGYRGVHVVSVAAKAIQAAYYGERPRTSYFVGCSDGGREGLMEAQRYPDDFDGIVAGAPANWQSGNHFFMGWGLRVNTRADGSPILTREKLQPLHDAVVRACDANDTVVGDGLIGDPRDCGFKPSFIQCPGADGPNCLTADQVRVVEALYAGPHDNQGRMLDPRFSPVGSELTWTGFFVPVPPPSTAPAGTAPALGVKQWMETVPQWMVYPLGKGKPFEQVQFTVDEFMQSTAKTSKYYDAVNPDLRRFRERGGKLMIYQGLADGLLPPSTTLDYYSAMRNAMGGQAQTDMFARLFLVNGMGHCPSPRYPSPDVSRLLLQMVKWVENGTAPEYIVASDLDGQRNRPVFRYPLVPNYVGPNPASNPTGPNKVQNYVAALPARLHDDDVRWVGDFLYAPPRELQTGD